VLARIGCAAQDTLRWRSLSDRPSPPRTHFNPRWDARPVLRSLGAGLGAHVAKSLKLATSLTMFIYRVGLDWLAASMGWAGWERVNPSLVLSVVGQFAGCD
jgi:hypothetical protein